MVRSAMVEELAGPSPRPWRDELVDVVRAASGGLLFGVPLLYTMEVWWVGSHTEPLQMLVLLPLLFVPLLLLNLSAGFRARRDIRVLDAAADAIEAMAIGILVTLAVLVMLQELTLETPLTTSLGKVLYECIPFCLGIGVARLLLHGSAADDDDAAAGSPEDSRGQNGILSATLADFGATAVGAAFVGLSIAPTDELPMLASTMTPAWLLVVMAASLATSYAIVFVAEFTRQDDRRAQEGPFQHPAVETVASYLIGLAVALLLLWVFQRDVEPLDDLLNRVLLLGFPAAIGGAAGRLAI